MSLHYYKLSHSSPNLSTLLSFEISQTPQFASSQHLIPITSIESELNQIKIQYALDPLPWTFPTFKSHSKELFEFLNQLIESVEEIGKVTKFPFHGNLKKENISIDKANGSIKLIEAQEIFKVLKMHKIGFASPPELSSHELTLLDDKIDVWSFGWLTYEIVTGREPWGLHRMNNYFKILREEELKYECGDANIIDFINKTLMYDPRKRIGWREMKEHVICKNPPMTMPIIPSININLQIAGNVDERSLSRVSVCSYKNNIEFVLKKEEIFGKEEHVLRNPNNEIIYSYIIQSYYSMYNLFDDSFHIEIEAQGFLTNKIENIDNNFIPDKTQSRFSGSPSSKNKKRGSILNRMKSLNNVDSDLNLPILNGNYIISALDKKAGEKIVIRIIETDFENPNITSYIQNAIAEKYFNTIMKEKMLGLIEVRKFFFESCDSQINCLVFFYDRFEYSFSNLLLLKGKLTISFKKLVIKEIAMLLLNFKKENCNILLAAFPYNILIQPQGLVLAFIPDMFVTSPIYENTQNFIDPSPKLYSDLNLLYRKLVYSLGIMMVEFFFQEEIDNNIEIILPKIKESKEVPPEIISLIYKMLQKNIKKRIDLEDVIKELGQTSQNDLKLYKEMLQNPIEWGNEIMTHSPKEPKTINLSTPINKLPTWKPIPDISKAIIYDILMLPHLSTSLYSSLLMTFPSPLLEIKMAYNCLKLNQNENAIKFAQSGLEMLKNLEMKKRLDGPKSENCKGKKSLKMRFSLLLILVETYNKIYQYDKSSNIFKSLFDLGSKIGGIREIVSRLNYSIYLKGMKKYEKAIKISEQALEMINQLKPSENSKKLQIELYLNISQIYLFQNLAERAINISKDAIRLCEINFSSFHPLLKKCYSFLGNLDFLQGNYLASSSDFEMAIDINKKLLPENHESFIELYYDWATACRKSEKYQEALRIYYKVLKLFESSKKINKTPNQIEEQAISINFSIAKTNFDINQFQHAIDFYEKVIQLEFASKRKLNYNKIYEEYYTLAICYNNIQDYNSAIERCHKIIEISKKNMDLQHDKYIDSFILLGDIFSNLENFGEVVNHYEEALKLLIKNNNKDIDKFFEVSGNLGLAYTNLKSFDEANKLITNTLNKYKSLYKKYENPVIFWLLNGIGIIYEGQKNYKSAIKNFEEGVIIAEKYYKPEPKYSIDMNVGIAKNLAKLGLYSESNEYYEKVRKLLTFINDRSILMGNLFINIAENYRKSKDIANALKNYKAGKKVYEKFVANDHQIIQKINKAILELENKN